MKNIEKKFSKLLKANKLSFEGETYAFFKILPPLNKLSFNEFEKSLLFPLPCSFSFFITHCSSGIINPSNYENIIDEIQLKVNVNNNALFKSIDLKSITSSFMSVKCYMDISNGNIWYNIIEDEKIITSTILDLEVSSSKPYHNFEQWILERLDIALKEIKRKKQILEDISRTIEISFYQKNELDDLKNIFSEILSVNLQRDYENEWEWLTGESIIYSVNISRKHLNTKGNYNEPISIRLTFKKEIDCKTVDSIKKNMSQKFTFTETDNIELSKNWLKQNKSYIKI